MPIVYVHDNALYKSTFYLLTYLSSAAWWCARRGCALINQLANMSRNKIMQSDLEMHNLVSVVLRTLMQKI